MGVTKGFAASCFSLLLLVLIFLLVLHASTSTSSAHGSAKFRSAKTSAVSDHPLGSAKSNAGFVVVGGDKDIEDGDSVFGDEKRRIHTGPNPLHNR
ncbi:hypothetical protein FNV43_RR03636 [Rhamnella rubrinervis]|uniref:Uncharacterized protein n=1 Tax=Rhamnella rubrinervis TaxID=2594499 RepID=A0A8K0HI42_9ROSA|nr:hypothetical protein FNV43_RR03636 [Rhamnella rubrinervis]